MKVLICDPISAKGIEYFQKQSELEVVVLEKRPSEDELISMAGDVSAYVVRSETKITAKVIEHSPCLKVVGRAGVGVDNVDVESATQRGIVVMNTPGGNTISTAELTFAMLMALARKIPQAHMSMSNKEWNRKAFSGTELYNKTLAILGLGRIGTEVAKRAQAFGMHVLAFDPYLSPSRAKAIQVEIATLDAIYAKADFITVHMPMTDETRGMINEDAFAKMKKGMRILNCARGGIVQEEDLVEAVKSGIIAGAAIDVYSKEPLDANHPFREIPEIITTPHLGASTQEAQQNVGIEIGESISSYLLTGAIQNAVNMPSLDAKTYAKVKPYLTLGQKLGRLVSQLAPQQNDRLVITFGGKATEMPSDPIARFILTGFLASAGGADVNQINAKAMAKSLGIVVELVKSNEETDFNEWLHVAAFKGEEKSSAGGTFFGAQMKPRIVRLDSQPVEIDPKGVLCLITNRDRPGIVGHLGGILAKHQINIANMSLHRDREGGHALTVLNLDSIPENTILDEIQRDEDISSIRIIKLS
ncbi:phosphoglycerate dehydrogenase [Verrucomicrobia bacterium]|nr:phosphoglycerate dehydrogenase [Verrucomicrobiota bacterium]MDB4704946.1 phosphoglycerate dehydrogenase [Verrucomicrobiota bacterium]MDC0263848.1 phosphoglycerate dehydrogenase [Verrucomicrobiota bacterium]MDC0299994.1 phosphoglycerate dehydrogenase [Verrucomicrobiota bacterium]MDG1857347.1 phosphoglycerate dehydrogenase [Verrucomicrobiota bacterium]